MSADQVVQPVAKSSPVQMRQEPRVSVTWRARVLVSAQDFLEGRTHNLSEKGVGLIMPRSFPPGTILTTALAVPQPNDRSLIKPVMLQIKVAFSVASGDLFKIGAQILKIDSNDQKLIDEWVNRLGTRMRKSPVSI